MIKAILWDADGVAIQKHRFFSERLSCEYGIPEEDVVKFFKGEFVLCATGKADLKEELAKYLPQWGVEKPMEELLEWWFSGESQKDEAVLRAVEDTRAQGVRAYLTTDQEKYRARYILDVMGFSKHFDKAFFSCDLGYRKSDKEFFERVLAEIKEEPQHVLYWDDDEKNIAVAREVGICAETYSSHEDFKKKMRDEYGLLK